MANVDVSNLLCDPDFIDAITIITRVSWVDNYGQNKFSETSLVTVGSVQPATGRVIQKLPEAMKVANVYSFFFKGQIITSEPGKYSSIIEFKGKKYQVQKVDDFSNWGEGYSEGTCIQEALT